jgi:hypothetical protein
MTKEEFIKNYGYLTALKAKTKDAIKISDFENYARGLTEEEKYWNAIQLVYNFHPAIDEVEGKKQIAIIVADYGIGIVMAMVDEAVKAKERDAEKQRLFAERAELKKRLDEINFQLFAIVEDNKKVQKIWKI